MVSRYECLKSLAPKITNELLVLDVGPMTREWGQLCPHEGNLYRVSLANVVPLALGLALALPHRRVIALEGDGSLLMGLHVLPLVASQNPSNFIIIVFDNEIYESTADYPTFTAGRTDLAKMAQGAGIENATLVRELSGFEKAINRAFQAKGTSFINAKVQKGAAPVFYSRLDGTENKYRFIRYIEETEKLEVLHLPYRYKLPPSK